MLDTKALAQATALIVREHLTEALSPVLARIAVLEERQLIHGKDGKDGVDGKDGMSADIEELKAFITDQAAAIVPDAVKMAVEALPPATNGRDGIDGKDGESVDVDALRGLIVEHASNVIPDAVKSAVEALPPPSDGRDGIDGKDGNDGKDGRDGADADPSVLRSQFELWLTETPLPKDGKDGRDGIDGKDGSDGIDGKDGAGIADLLIDRSGNLVATMTDGRMKELGRIIGADGQDGKDGVDGQAGKDGESIGPENFDMELMEDGRTLRIAISKGDSEYAFQIPFPVVIDRSDFADGKAYEEGDAVTFDGSLWIAQRDTSDVPGAEDSGWRLAVSKGADGADAYAGEAKGLYNPAIQYRALDVVSLNGSEWRAKCDNPGELPGADWMLGASKGKRGEQGKQGDRGKDGCTPVAAYVRGSELVVTLSDGQEIKADLSVLHDG